jgi:hypothetical protein
MLPVTVPREPPDMEYGTVIAWAQEFVGDEDTSPLFRLFCYVLLNTEPVQEFIAERDRYRRTDDE